MHKKLEAELVSLAHNILQMKNKSDAIALREKARLLYERLSVLTFVDEYLNTTPNAVETKEKIIAKIEAIEKVELIVGKDEVEELIEQLVEDKIENPVKVEIKEEKEIVTDIENDFIEEPEEPEEPVEVEIEQTIFLEKEISESKKQITLQEEFKDSVSVDVTTNLFTKIEDKILKGKPSLNDTLKSNIQVGLNDRIAFVKYLFDHSQADFNRVLSQLNSFKTEQEAMSFINKMVKPDYDWRGKEEYETRFLELVKRKFL
tara:strand:- start:1679 stop:2458 length:780 start_codon:yes stop_codon:yes gene_type:complete